MLLLGGTFDPPHAGHLFLAEAALEILKADRVLLVPGRIPPHKDPPSADRFHRFAMTALACGGRPSLVPEPAELERPAPSYTIRTLEALAASPQRPAVLILGADMLLDFPRWREPRRILERAALLAFPRAGTPVPKGSALPDWMREAQVPASAEVVRAGAILMADREPPQVSSSGLRSALREGKDVTDLVPAAVLAYIQKTRLYT